MPEVRGQWSDRFKQIQNGSSKWNVPLLTTWRHRWATAGEYGMGAAPVSVEQLNYSSHGLRGVGTTGEQTRAWDKEFCCHIHMVWAEFEPHWNMDPPCLVSLAQHTYSSPSSSFSFTCFEQLFAFRPGPLIQESVSLMIEKGLSEDYK